MIHLFIRVIYFCCLFSCAHRL